jgi:predicted TIM-barrel fold metal-dependent hydrolase
VLIDACVHHHWPDQDVLLPYMSDGWREYLLQPRALGIGSSMTLLPKFPYHRPDGDLLEAAEDVAARSDPVRMLERLSAVDRIVLSHDEAMWTTAQPNPHLSVEIARAVNDWTAEHWLRVDPRLHALILVPNQLVPDAVEEIARMGDDPGMVGILLGANGANKPLGHPTLHPIYAAAAEHELPIVIHAGLDAPSEVLTSHTPGGMPATYAEYRAYAGQSLMAHLISLIVQGVFDRHPGLRVLLMGGGVSWLPSFLWRSDAEYVAYRRETPWVSRPPTEYVREHVRIGTWRMALPAEPERMVRLLRTIDGIEDVLVYGSGYPHWDTMPAEALAFLPGEWQPKVLGENARELFRWRARTDHEAMALDGGA